MPSIAAGHLKGMALSSPRHIRATESKVRQAMFNILGAAVEGARVIDGFAGSGALGLEALSRGASEVVFLESHAECLNAIEQNLLRLRPDQVPGRWDVRPGDVFRSLTQLAGKGGPFDLILLDPPYEGPWGKKSLLVVAECGILNSAGVLCIEHALHGELPERIRHLAVVAQHRYGQTVLSFYRVT